MEAALFVVDLIAMLVLVIWSISRERAATKMSGLSAFDYKPGAECDVAPPAKIVFRRRN